MYHFRIASVMAGDEKLLCERMWAHVRVLEASRSPTTTHCLHWY